MKLKFDITGKTQPDPFIFKDDDGKLYIYSTGVDGIHAYCANAIEEEWKYVGVILSVPRGDEYWAPSMIKLDGKYYLYFSYHIPGMFEHMHVAVSDKPIGPFEKLVRLYKRFTIDSHVVKTEAGLFLWYAEDNENCDRIGTRVMVLLLQTKKKIFKPKKNKQESSYEDSCFLMLFSTLNYTKYSFCIIASEMRRHCGKAAHKFLGQLPAPFTVSALKRATTSIAQLSASGDTRDTGSPKWTFCTVARPAAFPALFRCVFIFSLIRWCVLFVPFFLSFFG